MGTGLSSDDERDDERRRADRVMLELPIKGRVGGGDHLDLAVVDISKGGMQIRCPDFDGLKKGFNAETNLASFEIHITARLAWAQPGDDGEFLTGWEFEGAGDEARVG